MTVSDNLKEKISIFPTNQIIDIENLNSLPDEIILTIFKNLIPDIPILAQVNKHWLHLVDNSFNQTAVISFLADKIFCLKNWQDLSKEISIQLNNEVKLDLNIIPEIIPKFPRCVYKEIETKDQILTLIPKKIKMINDKNIMFNESNFYKAANHQWININIFEHDLPFENINEDKDLHWSWIDENILKLVKKEIFYHFSWDQFARAAF